MTPRVVAIDGAAGSGKSTLARRLAVELGMPYVNTGSMYRALTLEALHAGVDLDDGSGLETLMGTLEFTLSPMEPRELWIGGSAPPAALESPEVEANVSRVAEHPEVRSAMRRAQRLLGEDGAVMEGRDIGSVVFPDAPVKLFLSAHPEERDRRDARVNPFVPTPDAVVLDTSRLDAEATVAAALAAVRDRAPELVP